MSTAGKVFAAVIAFGYASPAAAIGLDFECSEFRPMLQDRQLERPKPPFCATMYGTFDEYSFDSCKFEMDRYQSKVQKYLNCLVSENKNAVEEFNDTVRQFNLRAQ